MRVAIRTDASPRIGIGHARRCSALSQSLRALGAQVVFVMRDLGIDSKAFIAPDCDYIELPRPAGSFEPGADDPAHAAWAEAGFAQDSAETIEALRAFAPDWVVVDHYAFDHRWHARVRAALGARICVIDDLADRRLEADVLVDHNLDADHRKKYAHAAPGVLRLLGGPRYALLAAAYRDAREYEFSARVESIGVFLGGTDPLGLSVRVVEALRTVAAFAGRIEVVTSSANPRLADLRDRCAAFDATISVDQPDLVDFYGRHDLQIGAGGGAALERCRIGPPTLALVTAENQAVVVRALAAAGAVKTADENTREAIGTAAKALIDDTEARRALASAARRLVDGRGSRRVGVALASDRVTLRNATPEDAQVVFPWRNDERIREVSRSSRAIGLPEHLEWWRNTLKNPKRHLLIAQCGAQPVGTLRIDQEAEGGAEVSIYLDPDLAGVGLGRTVLEAGQAWSIRNLPALGSLRAEILSGNRASAALFSAAGFSKITDTQWRWEVRR